MDSHERTGAVTLRDIAKSVGVSEMTVSLALRNSTRISAPRRKEVQEAATKMGYRPDAMASALAHRRWSAPRTSIKSALAWLNHWPNPADLRSFKQFDAYWKGAHDAAERRGFRLEEFVWNDALPLPRIKQILLARDIRGILIPPHPRPLDWGDFPLDEFSLVRFGRSVTNPPVDMVTDGQVTQMMMIFDEVRKRGYQRIGYVTSETYERTTLFEAGFLKAQLSVTAKSRLPLLKIQEPPTDKDGKALARWIKQHRPAAIVTSIRTLRKVIEGAGYRVPQDIALAATSVRDCDADSGLQQNAEEIGRAAVALLVSLLQGNRRGIPEYCREVLVHGYWVDGATLPQAGKTANRPPQR